MFKTPFIILAAAALVSTAYAADLSPDSRRVLSLVKGRLDVVGQKAKLMPYGLYEVTSGNHVFYVDKDVKFFFSGHVFDVATQKDLTQAKIDEITRIDVKILKDALPQALVTKKGNGARTLYLFADPYCHYCKQLEQTLEKVDNVTIYTFVSPLLDSDEMVEKILSSKNPEKAWRDWMTKGIQPEKASGKKEWVQKNAKLVEKIGLDGVPVIYFSDGSRSDGAIGLKELNEKLDTLGR